MRRRPVLEHPFPAPRPRLPRPAALSLVPPQRPVACRLVAEIVVVLRKRHRFPKEIAYHIGKLLYSNLLRELWAQSIGVHEETLRQERLVNLRIFRRYHRRQFARVMHCLRACTEYVKLFPADQRPLHRHDVLDFHEARGETCFHRGFWARFRNYFGEP